jgi:hypothetical protein
MDAAKIGSFSLSTRISELKKHKEEGIIENSCKYPDKIYSK